jgi:quercetin dioxygenase-like cupin family protein
MRIGPVVRIVTLVVVALRPAVGVLAEEEPLAVSPATLKFSTPPGLRPCTKAAALKGDPAKGPAVVLAKVTAGCRTPWHWHTAGEQLLIISGTGTVEMKDGKPLRIASGAYTSLPGHHVHQVTCTSACTLFVVSDAAFDIHYFDHAGNEIPPEQALKSGAKHRRR